MSGYVDVRACAGENPAVLVNVVLVVGDDKEKGQADLFISAAADAFKALRAFCSADSCVFIHYCHSDSKSDEPALRVDLDDLAKNGFSTERRKSLKRLDFRGHEVDGATFSGWPLSYCRRQRGLV